MTARPAVRALSIVALVSAALPSLAADILLTPPAGGGVSMTNAAGNATRFRVADDGAVTLPGVTAVPVPATGLCVEIATGRVGTCAAGGGTLTAVTASAPLASSGGSTPNISLTGTIPVANGGTGATTFATNGILYGQGTGAISTTVGAAGQVLTGTAGAPAWTGSPSISGNLTLVNSTLTTGHIMKGPDRFIHNSGTNNTFIGVNAGNFTMTGAGNTAAGYFALQGNTTGQSNIAIGQSALFSNTSGNYNTAIGFLALATSTGSSNTATGYFVLESNTTGSNNTAIGQRALDLNTTGSSNIAIGINAGSSLTTGSANIAIGNTGVAAESSTIRIGTPQTRAFIAGIRGVTTGNANAVPVLIDSNGQLGTASTSRQEGEFTFAGGSAGVNVKTITFPTAFGTAPKVMVTPKTDDFGGGPVNDTIVASVRSISTTEFQVNVFRVDIAGSGWSANTRLTWLAWQ